MIARLEGNVLYKSPEYAILDVNGVGYQVFIPLSTFYELPETDSPVSLHTYTHLREDVLQLYGFKTMAEKIMFMSLISISGIGPKLAVNILSGIGVTELEQAILSEDISRIISIPGVGKKTAERMVIELRDKIGKKTPESYPATIPVTAENKRLYADAVSALVNLGYKKAAAEAAMARVERENKGLFSLEEILKQVLKVISRS
ncbi:MAG: Holliday junction branch migration protein RuvA [Thermodesulfobacteriota bacterium]